MAENKIQHFIPQTYLRAWCDPNTPPNYTPYVWRFNRDGSDPRKKAPEKIFQETDMYTIKGPNGERDLRLEKGLASLESDFAVIRDKKLKSQKIISKNEFFTICTFIAAMEARTKAMREHQANQWGKILDIANMVKGAAEKAQSEGKEYKSSFTPHQFSRAVPVDFEQLEATVKNPLQNLMLPMIEVITPLLSMMDMIVFETQEEPGFITSDHPCVWFDPEAYKQHPAFRSPGLGSPSIEVILPVSNKQTILLTHKDGNGYVDANEKVVNEINRRVILHAYEYFVANSKVTKDSWFLQK